MDHTARIQSDAQLLRAMADEADGDAGTARVGLIALEADLDDEFGWDATEIWRTAAQVRERFDDADQALRAYRMALSCSGHSRRVLPAALESQGHPNTWACQHFLSVKQMPPDLSGTSLFRMPVAR